MKKLLIMTALVIGIFMVGKTIMDSQVTTPQEAVDACNKEFGLKNKSIDNWEPYYKKFKVSSKEEFDMLFAKCLMKYVP